VLLASHTAVLFIREQAGTARIIGMVLSLAAILLIMLSDLHVFSS
jgi:multidrug transporter EmrE-like cation transporter